MKRTPEERDTMARGLGYESAADLVEKSQPIVEKFRGNQRDEGGLAAWAGEAFADFITSDAPITPQIRHARKRGKHVAKCGSYEGQTTDITSAVTCPTCIKKTRKSA